MLICANHHFLGVYFNRKMACVGAEWIVFTQKFLAGHHCQAEASKKLTGGIGLKP